MKPWLLILWFVGLFLVSAGSWLAWTYATVPDPNLHFAASLAPVVIWALVPVLFWRFFMRSNVSSEAPAMPEQRRAVLDFLADRGFRSRRARYSVPFFLVAGPSGSGKSSILERSELTLGMPKTIGNTSWWVGRDAVFIETRLGAGETEPTEAYALLRSIRPKLPVNATLLVLSPADLTLSDRVEQNTIAQAMANGLRYLDEAMQVRVPVYFLLSRIDLVPGFREFFDRTEPQERSQPWGFALSDEGAGDPPPAERRHAEIDRGFQEILAAMRVRQIERLSREVDPVRCGHIHGFAAQIAAIQRTILPVLDAFMSEQGQIWKGALVRGIFLTSARQEVLSIDALLPELSRRFAMPRSGMLPPDLGMEDEDDHGYFIGGILKKAVFPEAGLVLRQQGSALYRILRWVPIVALVLICVAAGYFLFNTFDREIRLTSRASEVLAGTQPLASPATRKDLPTVLAYLRRLRSLGAEIAGEPSSRYAVGLTARTRLASSLDDARHNLRINALAPQLSALLEADLVDEQTDVSALKHLLAVAESATDADSPLLHQWLEQRAAELFPDDSEELIAEGLKAVREAGGLTVGKAYVDAAHRLIAYKESLS